MTQKKNITVLSLDTLGDITLRQPLFAGLLDADYKVTVVVQAKYQNLISLIDKRLNIITTEINPYKFAEEKIRKQLSILRARIKKAKPKILVCAPYNYTYVDVWLMYNFADVERIGFARNKQFFMPYEYSMVLNIKKEFLDFSNMFARVVKCKETDHEIEKSKILFEAITNNSLSQHLIPTIILDKNIKEHAVKLLKQYSLTPKKYVIGCPAGIANNVTKAWPISSYVNLIIHLKKEYNLPVLLVGIEKERTYLNKIAVETKANGVDVCVWIGTAATLETLFGIIFHSLFYLGSDTGPMHFAGALNIPVVALFGGGNWPRFLPAGKSFVATQKLPCFKECNWQCWLQEPLCINLVDDKELKAGIKWILSNDKEEQKIHEGKKLDVILNDTLDAANICIRKQEEQLKQKEDFIHLQQTGKKLVSQKNSKLNISMNNLQCRQSLKDKIKVLKKRDRRNVRILKNQNKLIFKLNSVLEAVGVSGLKSGCVLGQEDAELKYSDNHCTGLKYRLKQAYYLFSNLFRPKLNIALLHLPKVIHIPKKYYLSDCTSCNNTISIVTPSYNQGNFLEETIRSVLEQEYPNLEYVVQDGNSADNSRDILNKYNEQLTYWESENDKGQTNAINKGFKHVTGDIMAYLNSDDLLLPGALSYVNDYFNKHPEVDVIYGNRVLINSNSCEVGRWVLPPHDDKVLSWVDYVPQETLFWRRSIWEKVGASLDEKYNFAMDWDLLLRFRSAGAKMIRVPRFLGAFRIHGSQKTITEIGYNGQKEMCYLRFKYIGKNVNSQMIYKNIRWYLLKHLVYQKLYRIGLLRY